MSKPRLSLLVFFAGPWLTPLPAQDLLVLKTANEQIAENVLDAFESDSLPELGEGKHFVFTLGNDGKLTTTTGAGAVGLFQLSAKPALLAEHYAEQIQMAQQQAGMFAGMMSGNMGVPAQDLNNLIDEIFAFPAQLDTLTLDVTGSQKDGFDARLAIVPAEKGWFGAFVKELKPNPAGAPRLDAEDPLAHFALSVEPAAMQKAARPFMGFAVGAAATDKEERAKYTKLMEQFVALMDGTVSMVIGREGAGMRMLSGLTDGEKGKALMASDEYKAFAKAAAEANPMADAEITENAVVHREVTFTKQTVETGQDTPISPGGTTTSLYGVAGSFMISASSDAAAKAMTDQILDQKVERKALPNGAILALGLRLADLAEGMAGGMAGPADFPQTVSLELGQSSGRLAVNVKLGF